MLTATVGVCVTQVDKNTVLASHLRFLFITVGLCGKVTYTTSQEE